MATGIANTTIRNVMTHAKQKHFAKNPNRSLTLEFVRTTDWRATHDADATF